MTPLLSRPGWVQTGAQTAHFWRRDQFTKRLVSLCNHGPDEVPEADQDFCPCCSEGLLRAELVRDFLETHIHLDAEAAGKLMVVEPWYWEGVILPIYGTLRPDGQGGYVRVYKRALVGVPRWHIKSTTAAALALYHMTVEPMLGGECYCVATSIKQAGAIFAKARRMAKGNDLLRRIFYVPRGVIEHNESEEQFTALAHNADTAQGYHPHFAAVDEIHVHRNMDMINAMVSGAAGYSEPMIFCITTAGAERKGIWWEILKSWPRDPGTYIFWLGATDADDPADPAVWRRVNPASWVTDARLREEFDSQPLPSFMRYHLNLAPRKGQNKVFTAARWDACAARPDIDLDRPCIVATDASVRRDHTAVLLDQVGPDHYHNLLLFPFTAEDPDDPMSSVDLDEVGGLLRELYHSFEVRRMPCDRAYFVRTIRELLAEGLPIEAFEQTDQNMSRACQSLYDAVVEGRIRHGGDPLLRDHILNATIKEVNPRWGGWRITKPADGEHVDAAIAAAMVVDVAEVEFEDGSVSAAVG